MIRSFLSGLLARHLAQRAKMRDAEEAFICGLFRNLGENLSVYYFPEDYEEVKELVDAQLEESTAASIRVLGVSFAEIGMEVARIWGLPESIIASMGSGCADEDEVQTGLRSRAAFANELCALVSLKAIEGQDAAFERLIEHYGKDLGIDAEYTYKLLRAGIDKLDQDAAILEFDTQRSPFCDAARAWLERVAPEESEEAEVAAG
jgi:HD-like signal output (HDOD) protein